MVASACRPSGTVAHALSVSSASPLSAVTVMVMVMAVIASAWQRARMKTFRRVWEMVMERLASRQLRDLANPTASFVQRTLRSADSRSG
jgi:hypothetical protein